MRSEFKNSVQIEKLWLISRCYKEAISIARFGVCIYSLSPIKGKSHKLSWYHEETVKKKRICAKEPRSNSLVSRKSKAWTELRNVTEFLLSLVLATTSSFMHDWSRHSILSQSRVPLYEKYRAVIYAYALGYMDYTFISKVTRVHKYKFMLHHFCLFLQFIPGRRGRNFPYDVACSVSGKDETNPSLWFG